MIDIIVGLALIVIGIKLLIDIKKDKENKHQDEIFTSNSSKRQQ